MSGPFSKMFEEDKSSSPFSAMLEAERKKEAEAVGEHYRNVFRPSGGQRLFRDALMVSESAAAALGFPIWGPAELIARGVNKGSELLGGPKISAVPTEAYAEHQKKLGLEPENTAERLTSAVAGGMGAAGGISTAANAASAVAKNPVVRNTLSALAARPDIQAVSGAGAGLGSQAGAELGLPPLGQFGLGLAGGFAPVVWGLPAMWRAGSRYATDSRAPEIVTKSLADAGMTPAQAADTLAPNQTVAELSKPLSDLAGAVVRRSPEAAAKADALVEARKGVRSTELLGRIESDIARSPATAMQADDVLVEMEKQAAPLYDAAFNNAPQIIVPKDLLSRPSVAAAYRKAQAMAKEKGYSLPDMRMDAVQPIPPLSLRQADFLKRAMDDEIYLSRAPEKGVGVQQLKDMKGTRTQLVQAIDQQAGPEYAAARAKFAGPAQAREALELGLKADKMSAEEINRYLLDPSVSEFEKMAFRIGAANQMKQRIAGVSDAREPANLFASPNAQQSMGQLSHEGPPYLPELVSRQRKQAKFEQGLLGGSQTQPRAKADEALDDATAKVGGSLADMLIKPVLDKAKDRLMTGNDATMKELTQMLLSTDPVQQQMALKQLQMRLAFPGRALPASYPVTQATSVGLLSEPQPRPQRQPMSLLGAN